METAYLERAARGDRRPLAMFYSTTLVACKFRRCVVQGTKSEDELLQVFSAFVSAWWEALEKAPGRRATTRKNEVSNSKRILGDLEEETVNMEKLVEMEEEMQDMKR